MKQERYLQRLTNAAEIFGLLGRGYPHSFYKVYVRASPKGRWWRFDYEATPWHYNPIEHQKLIEVDARIEAMRGTRNLIEARVETVHGTLQILHNYEHHPEKKALIELWNRVKELATDTKTIKGSRRVL